MSGGPELPSLVACTEGLDAVELVRVRLPLRHTIVAGHGVESIREVVLVRALGADGSEGWGECSALEVPTYTGEYTAGAWAVLRDHLVPAAFVGRFGHLRGHPMASAALEIALTDRWLRLAGRSLTPARGEHQPDPPGMAWTAVVGVQDSIDDLLDLVGSALGAHAARVKLKIRPGWDLEPAAATLGAFPDVTVSVDANGCYSERDRDALVKLADLLAARPGAYLEQPLPSDDLVGHGRLASLLAVPLALDESIMAPGDAVTATTLGAAGLVNVKPARLGGLRSTRLLAETLAGMDPVSRPGSFLGGMLETGVGRSAALSIAAAAGMGISRTDLGPSAWYFERDLTSPVTVATDGLLSASTDPGVGLHPQPDLLSGVTVDRVVLRGRDPV